MRKERKLKPIFDESNILEVLMDRFEKLEKQIKHMEETMATKADLNTALDALVTAITDLTTRIEAGQDLTAEVARVNAAVTSIQALLA